MRLSAPRIAPLTDAEMTDEQRAAVAPMAEGGRPVLNIFRTLARAPKQPAGPRAGDRDPARRLPVQERV
jgi:hypothetical protein